MTNYFNPQAVAPQIQPNQLGGALHGAWEVDRNEMYKRAMGLQELSQQAALEQQQAQNDRYRQVTPYEVMQQRGRGLEAQAREPHLADLALGEVGKARQEQAKGDVAMGTRQTDMDRINVANELTTLEKGARMLEAYGQTSMLEAQGPYQEFRKSLSPQMQRYFPPHYTPDVNVRIQKFSEWLKNTPEYRQKQGLQEQSESAEFARHVMDNEARTGQVAMQADAQVRAAQERGDRPGAAETKDKAVARLRMELPKDPFNQEKLMEYRSHLEDIWGKQLQEDMSLGMLKFKALNSDNEAEKKKAAEAYMAERNRFFAERGIYLKAPKVGDTRDHPTLGKLRWKGGFNRNPADLNNWERIAPPPQQQNTR